MRLLLRALLVALLAISVGSPALAQRQKASSSRTKKPKARGKQSSKRAVVFIGLPGSGKTFVSHKLAKKLGLEKPLISGDIVREAIGKTKTPAERANRALQVSKDFAKKKGEIGRRIAKKARKLKGDVVVVEGFRSPDDMAAFREAFPNTTVVALDVPATLRHERMLARGRAGEDNLAYLRKRDKHERGVGVDSLIKAANLKVKVRSNDPAELSQVLDSIAAQAKAKPNRRTAKKR